MEGSQKRIAILTLKAIAAQAEKLAADLERGSLWEGEYSQAIGAIMRQINDLPDGRGR